MNHQNLNRSVRALGISADLTQLGDGILERNIAKMHCVAVYDQINSINILDMNFYLRWGLAVKSGSRYISFGTNPFTHKICTQRRVESVLIKLYDNITKGYKMTLINKQFTVIHTIVFTFHNGPFRNINYVEFTSKLLNH